MNEKISRFFLSARIANGIADRGKQPFLLLPNNIAAHTTLKEHRCCTAKLLFFSVGIRDQLLYVWVSRCVNAYAQRENQSLNI